MGRRNMFQVDVDGLKQLVAKRGKSFILFELYQNARDQNVLIHEFGHFYSGDHLSSEYHEALCKIGAKLSVLKLRRPDLFSRYR